MQTCIRKNSPCVSVFASQNRQEKSIYDRQCFFSGRFGTPFIIRKKARFRCTSCEAVLPEESLISTAKSFFRRESGNPFSLSQKTLMQIPSGDAVLPEESLISTAKSFFQGGSGNPLSFLKERGFPAFLKEKGVPGVPSPKRNRCDCSQRFFLII